MDRVDIAERHPGDIGAGLLAPGFGGVTAGAAGCGGLMDAMAEHREVGCCLSKGTLVGERHDGGGSGQRERATARDAMHHGFLRRLEHDPGRHAPDPGWIPVFGENNICTVHWCPTVSTRRSATVFPDPQAPGRKVMAAMDHAARTALGGPIDVLINSSTGNDVHPGRSLKEPQEADDHDDR